MRSRKSRNYALDPAPAALSPNPECSLENASSADERPPLRARRLVPEPGGLGIHLTLDLGGPARFGLDVEWVDTTDYSVDPERARRFYAAIRRYWPALSDGALIPAYSGIRPKRPQQGNPISSFKDRKTPATEVTLLSTVSEFSRGRPLHLRAVSTWLSSPGLSNLPPIMPPPTSPFDYQMLTRRIRQSCKIAAWILFLAVIELSLVPPSFRPTTVIPHGFEHFIIFFLMGLAFELGYARRVILTTSLLNGFVGLIKIAQLFVPAATHV